MPVRRTYLQDSAFVWKIFFYYFLFNLLRLSWYVMVFTYTCMQHNLTFLTKREKWILKYCFLIMCLYHNTYYVVFFQVKIFESQLRINQYNENSIFQTSVTDMTSLQNMSQEITFYLLQKQPLEPLF